ncbi:uncharacterized protein BO95DRAFT_84998 [Aspergillus brunneoviolaceus CBS 621.78]|uniref:Uncharacterized protein n=1 Tax=Aspergillus brunneoviolaceus CBS 621.78 TaxID=1450534 RepID=A0ACD1GDV5_9EURO|nr:hypothetical protein BO95DRAFT_84998 [Aspergillus brunneoviolaceus CBS 621.78]RAH47469.1 hypothetical protein BO95DRAFT_84998 [Aspergillus brunneoviolaceus CBS 621.78]
MEGAISFLLLLNAIGTCSLLSHTVCFPILCADGKAISPFSQPFLAAKHWHCKKEVSPYHCPQRTRVGDTWDKMCGSWKLKFAATITCIKVLVRTR